jgi:hypothetical protein
MLELYFLIYRVPRMMTRAARERNRSGLAWSLMGIGAWLAAECFVLFGGGLVYGLGSVLFGWPVVISPGIKLLLYIIALGAALGSVTLVQRILYSRSTEKDMPLPPPPPQF